MTDRSVVEATFVALHALPAIVPEVSGAIGGTETRAWTLARGLAKFETSVRPQIVVRGSTSKVPHAIDDVRLLAKPEPLYEWYVNVGRSIVRRRGFPPLALTRWDPRLSWQLPAVDRPSVSRAASVGPNAANAILRAASRKCVRGFWRPVDRCNGHCFGEGKRPTSGRCFGL